MIRISKAQREHHPEIRGFVQDLYRTSFPRSERRPFAQICAFIDESDLFELHLIYSGQSLCGFFSLWRLADFAYIEHFAIHPNRRGSGLGAEVLTQWHKRFDAIVFEVEPAEISPHAEARIRFYIRAGFTLLDFDHIQPPYHADESPLSMRLMCNTAFAARANPKTISHLLHQQVYGQTQT